jgi:hypothetical protein
MQQRNLNIMKKLYKILSASLITLLLFTGLVIGDTFNQGEVQLIEDGDMEDSDGSPTSAWTSVLSATLTKQSGSVYDGSQVLRVAYGGSSNPIGAQLGVFTLSNTYRVTGCARGDGTYAPRVSIGNNNYPWTGTSSTDWQCFDFYDDTGASTAGHFYLSCQATGAGYCEFDDVFATDYIPPVKDAESNIYDDGDMELAGTAEWPSVGTPTLTKQSGFVDDGSQVLRVAYNGTNNPYVYQAGTPNGTEVRITGWFRGDGASAYPRIANGSGVLVVAGTTSTDWQYFDERFTIDSNNLIRIYCTASAAGYVEYDDVLVTLDTPPNKNFYSQLLVDGDMEAATTASYAAINGATLTKESGAIDDGLQVLRVARNGVNNPLARQTILTTDVNYRVTGCARSDGNAVPYLYVGGGSADWVGTNSTDWQCFDMIDPADAQFLYLQAVTSTGTEYVEWDDVFITQL